MAIARTTVVRIVENFTITNNFERSSGSGRPGKGGEFEQEMLVEGLVENNLLLRKAKTQLHKKTGKKILHCINIKQANLASPKVRELTSKQLTDREEFKLIVSQIRLEGGIWCDESAFTVQWKITQKE